VGQHAHRRMVRSRVERVHAVRGSVRTYTVESLQMKAYLVVTGTIFGLVGAAHLLRLFVEGNALSDPWFLANNLSLFLVGGGLAVWAARLVVRLRGPSA
jgi:hypothetical protein